MGALLSGRLARSTVGAAAALAVFALCGPADARSQTVSGTVIDGDTGAPLAHVAVAAMPAGAANQALMNGDDAPAAALVTTTDDSGRFSLPRPSGTFFLDAYGARLGHVSFHGTFERDAAGTIRLLRPTDEERAALAQLNGFRAERGVTATLVFDENLMESARYWAALERSAQRIGHTCEALGNPQGCVEFNAFYHSLPGAPSEWFCGQNAAFDTVSAWSDPDRGFEDEEHQAGGERGHYINIISANRWIGLGKAGAPGVGTFFAMNVL